MLVTKLVTNKLKEKANIKINVIERAGRSVKSLLPGLKTNDDCGRRDCMLHTTGGRGDCNKEGIVYKGECLLCKSKGKSSIYIGESSRSAYFRGIQHMKAIKKPKDNEKTNAFAKHLMEHHAGEKDTKPFQMTIIDSYRRPLQRQIREGIEIYRCNTDIAMNSKLDHYQPGVRRIVFTNSIEE